MTVGSGLAAQIGFAAETTWGTPATPDHFYAFNSEGVELRKNILQGLGLRAGAKFKRASHRQVSTSDVGGPVVMDWSSRKMGLLVKHMLGSALTTPTQQGATTAYKQVHTPAGGFTGLGLTYQKGVPQTDGTVQPFTHTGCKITEWELTVSTGGLLTLTLTIDGKSVATSTALAAASYVADENFAFSDVTTFTLGGTASTASGEVSIAGGTDVSTLINQITIHGTNPMKVDRYGLGNAGLKGQQIENDYPTYTVSVDGEFTSRAELYDLFAADSGTAIHVAVTGSQIDVGQNNTLDIVIPVAKFNTGAVNVGGPDVVPQSLEAEILDDDTNQPIQLSIVSADTAL